jgi:hypothetical protein
MEEDDDDISKSMVFMLTTIIVISTLLGKLKNHVHKVTLDMYGRSIFRHVHKIVKSEC